MLYRTTDNDKWGAGKGSNLNPGEVDNNFYNADQRLAALENDPPTAVSISNITIAGSQIQFNMSDGSHFGPFTLPIATFQLRGDWNNSMVLHELDLVSVPGQGLFLVRLDHTTPDSGSFDPDATDGDGNALYLRVFGEDAYIYDVGVFYPGKPGLGIVVGGYMAAHIFARPVTLPGNLPGSYAKLRVAAAADLSFAINKGDGTAIGSIEFTATETEGAFVFVDDVAFETGDMFYIQPPSSVDTDARDLIVTLVGRREDV